MDGTQIIEGLCAARVIPECFFKELGSLLIVLLDEHRAAFVVKCSGVITVCRHGDVCVPLSLLIVLLLQQRKSQHGASKIKIEMKRGSYRDKKLVYASLAKLMRASYQEVEEGQVGACGALRSGVLLFKGLQGFYGLITVNKTQYFSLF